MEDRQQLELVLETEYDQRYNIDKKRRMDKAGTIDYVLSSKKDPEKQIFLFYKENAAMISDVVKLDYLKRVKFPGKKNYDYVIYCGGPSDEINEDIAKAAGIHYYKNYDVLENKLRDILDQ